MFTFKVSRFSFLPIRIWLSKIELSILTVRLRSSNRKTIHRLELMDAYLQETNTSLGKMVNLLWDHFVVPDEERLNIIDWLDQDPLPHNSTLLRARTNFVLLEEYHHYNALLKKEEARSQDELQRSRRMAPFWLRREQAHLKYESYLDKEMWKADWRPGSDLLDGVMHDYVSSAFQDITNIIGICVTAGFLSITILYIMIIPGGLVVNVATFLSSMAMRFHSSFTEIYACFAVAIFILTVIAIVWVSIVIPNPKPDPLLLIDDLDRRTQERLAELAYIIAHDLGGSVEHLEQNSSSLVLDELRKDLQEFEIRQGLS